MRKITNTLILLVSLLLGLCILSGCGAEKDSPVVSEVKFEFVDDDGMEVTFDQPFERIICLYSAHTENLYTLGAGAQIVGGHSTCVYPPEAAFLPVYDYNGDVEAVIAAEPDLVLIRPFISRRVPEYVDQLRQAGITVVSLYPETFEAFPEYIRRLGLLTGTEEEAGRQLQLMEERLDRIQSQTALAKEQQTVFFESTETNIRTVTDDSMPGLAIAMAGGINLAEGVPPSTEGSSIAEFGIEKVLMRAEEIDVYVSQRGAMNAGGNLQSIGERPGYETLKAVQDGRVYVINEKLISSPTFRYYIGVREMSRFLYPDIMDDLSFYQNERITTKRDFANIIVRAAHLPVYVPSSSKYYQSARKGHTYGLFEDLFWLDEDFDYIETAVHAGYVEWESVAEKEFFRPEQTVTREELARALFIIGTFRRREPLSEITDLDETKHPEIVQTLVAYDIFTLADGQFEPQREVTNQEVLQAFAAMYEVSEED